MTGTPRGSSARRRRPRSWQRKAVLLQRAAIGCYAATILLAGLAFAWPACAWLAVGFAIVGSWCQREAVFARRLAAGTQEEADVPDD